MFYVKIKPQLENDPVQGFGNRAVLGAFHIKYCDSRAHYIAAHYIAHFYLPQLKSCAALLFVII